MRSPAADFTASTRCWARSPDGPGAEPRAKASTVLRTASKSIAGTAAAVMGVTTTGGGAVLAAVIDQQVDDTVTPMAVGTLGYAVVAMGFTLWASGGSSAPIDPDGLG